MALANKLPRVNNKSCVVGTPLSDEPNADTVSVETAPSVAGNAQNYVRAKRRASSPAADVPVQDAEDVGVLDQATLYGSGLPPVGTETEPADTSAEDAHSVVTEVQDAHSEKLPPSSSSSSVPEAIGAASDAASITPEVPCSIPNSVRSGSMTSMSSQKAQGEEPRSSTGFSIPDMTPDADHDRRAMIWEARRRASRLPYWKPLDLELDEEAKRSILEEAHQTIWNQMDRWFTRLAEFAEQIKDPLKRKAYDHSYVTPYQLERLEMSTREDLSATELFARQKLRSDFRERLQLLKDMGQRAEKALKASSIRFEGMEAAVRKVIAGEQNALFEHMYDHHQTMTLILNELKRVNHEQHVARYYRH